MSDADPRFRLEVNDDEDLLPADYKEIQEVVEHLLDGGAVVYLEDNPTHEEMDKLEAFVDEEIRGGDDD